MMTTDEAITMLTAYAERLIEATKITLTLGLDVLALFVTVNANGDTKLYGLAGDLNSHARAIFRQHMAAADKAIATLMFGDANVRDETGKIVGEALDAMIESRSGTRLVVSCRYQRKPTLEFEPILTTPHVGMVTMDTFPQRIH